MLKYKVYLIEIYYVYLNHVNFSVDMSLSCSVHLYSGGILSQIKKTHFIMTQQAKGVIYLLQSYPNLVHILYKRKL